MSRFDEDAKTWDTPDKVARAKVFTDEIMKRLDVTAEMNIFELGTGTGINAVMIADHVKSITAGDSSNGMLEELKKKLVDRNIENIKPIFFDAENQTKTDEKYDRVYSVMVMHHIKNISQTAKTIYNMLKENGKAVILDLDKENGDFHPDKTGIHHFGFSEGELRKYFGDAGFEKIKFEICYEINRGNKVFPVFALSVEK